MAYLINRNIAGVGHQLTYCQSAFAPHAGAHPATGECLPLIWTHTTTGGDLPNLSRANFLATTDNSLIRRQLKVIRRRKGVIEKMAQPTLPI